MSTKIGISAYGTAGDIMPMLEMGMRLESFGHDVTYLIFAADDTDYNKPTVRLDFDGEEFAKSDVDWFSPAAASLLMKESIANNFSLICHHCNEMCNKVDAVINHYMLKPMQGICKKQYTSFCLCPGAINSGIPELEAGLAIGEDNIIAVDSIFGGTGYYFNEIKQVELIDDSPVFMGFGSSQKFVADKAMEAFLAIEKGISKPCIIQGRDFDYLDHMSAFPQCSHIVHHGGGTVHSATQAGVSQTIIPLQGEHLYWAVQIEKLGLGMNAHNKTIDSIIKNIER